MKLRLPAVGIGSSSEEAGSKRQRQSSRAAKSTSQRRLSQGSQIGVVAAQPGTMRKVGRSAAEQTSPRSEQRLRLPPVCPSHTPEQPDGVSSASLSAGSYYSSSCVRTEPCIPSYSMVMSEHDCQIWLVISASHLQPRTHSPAGMSAGTRRVSSTANSDWCWSG